MIGKGWRQPKVPGNLVHRNPLPDLEAFPIHNGD